MTYAVWAILGAALQWSREESDVSSRQMAGEILLVVTQGIAHLHPEANPSP